MTSATIERKSSRSNGKSNAEVVFDLLYGAEPGATFTYEQIQEQLSLGLPPESLPVDRSRAYQAVLAARRRLLREERRGLITVKGVGYRIAYAHEHVELASRAERRAKRATRQRKSALRNTRTDELTREQFDKHISEAARFEGEQAGRLAMSERRERTNALIKELTARREEA